MDDFKTVEGEIRKTDPLLRKQKEGVAEMRTSLLACSGDPVRAIQEITAKRVYHQLIRIVRYTELMDQIESKLYDSIEDALLTKPTADPATWLMLINVQERLQDSMIKSHKLLEPYLGVTPEVSVAPVVEPSDDGSQMILDRASRDRVRNAAKQLLIVMDEENPDDN